MLNCHPVFIRRAGLGHIKGHSLPLTYYSRNEGGGGGMEYHCGPVRACLAILPVQLISTCNISAAWISIVSFHFVHRLVRYMIWSCWHFIITTFPCKSNNNLSYLCSFIAIILKRLIIQFWNVGRLQYNCWNAGELSTLSMLANSIITYVIQYQIVKLNKMEDSYKHFRSYYIYYYLPLSL